MKTFTKLREMLASNAELRLKIEKMEQRYDRSSMRCSKPLRNWFPKKKNPKRILGLSFKFELRFDGLGFYVEQRDGKPE